MAAAHEKMHSELTRIIARDECPSAKDFNLDPWPIDLYENHEMDIARNVLVRLAELCLHA